MAKLKGKGTVLQQTISATLTDVANVFSISLSGEESETFETTDLSTSVFKTYAQTGYTEPGTVEAGLFFDPALAGHAAIVALLTTPADCVWKVKYSDAGPSSITYTSAGIGLSQEVVMNDGLKATLTMKRTGAPTRA